MVYLKAFVKKFKELLVGVKEIGKVCVNAILPRLGENDMKGGQGHYV